MKNFIFILFLLTLLGCRDSLPVNEKETFREVIHNNDNYTSLKEIDYKTTVTEKSDNNSVSVTTTTIPSNQNTFDNLTQSDSEEFVLALFEGNYDNLTSGNFTAGVLPNLTFYLEGDYDKFSINQTGVVPSITDFKNTTNGFFMYKLNKDYVILQGANVNSDNVSDITLVYTTKLYTFVEKDLKISNLKPVDFTLYVK